MSGSLNRTSNNTGHPSASGSLPRNITSQSENVTDQSENVANQSENVADQSNTNNRSSINVEHSDYIDDHSYESADHDSAHIDGTSVAAAISYFNNNYESLDPVDQSGRESYLEPISCQTHINLQDSSSTQESQNGNRNTYLEIA